MTEYDAFESLEAMISFHNMDKCYLKDSLSA